jgi:hypothetical protein
MAGSDDGRMTHMRTLTHTHARPTTVFRSDLNGVVFDGSPSSAQGVGGMGHGGPSPLWEGRKYCPDRPVKVDARVTKSASKTQRHR